MKNLELKYRKLLRRIFGCISFTAVAFVFQACYGHPMDDVFHDVKLTGTVKSSATNLPINGIKVTAKYGMGMTDENGKYEFYVDLVHDDFISCLSVNFFDIDSTENGYFADTVIIVPARKQHEIEINVELDEKQ